MFSTYMFDYQPPFERDPEIPTQEIKFRKYKLYRQVDRAPQQTELQKQKEAEKIKEAVRQKLLLRIEWVPLNLRGKLLSPRLIPTDLTEEEKVELEKLFQETDQICLNEMREKEKIQELQKANDVPGDCDAQQMREMAMELSLPKEVVQRLQRFKNTPMYAKHQPSQCCIRKRNPDEIDQYYIFENSPEFVEKLIEKF